MGWGGQAEQWPFRLCCRLYFITVAVHACVAEPASFLLLRRVWHPWGPCSCHPGRSWDGPSVVQGWRAGSSPAKVPSLYDRLGAAKACLVLEGGCAAGLALLQH